ncbi:MAG: GreA/GreB family elongation factor [Myxococcota bacterium]
MPAPKQFFIEQLVSQLRQSVSVARRAEEDAREAATAMSTESEKKEDSRAALEFGSMATGQAARARKMQEELDSLVAFSAKPLPSYHRKTPVGLGAMVDVASNDETGHRERTFILLPVGAGTELSGPDGDGFLSVITPASPVGRALLGKRVGDTFDVQIKGEWHEWSVVDVA